MLKSSLKGPFSSTRPFELNRHWVLDNAFHSTRLYLTVVGVETINLTWTGFKPMTPCCSVTHCESIQGHLLLPIADCQDCLKLTEEVTFATEYNCFHFSTKAYLLFSFRAINFCYLTGLTEGQFMKHGFSLLQESGGGASGIAMAFSSSMTDYNLTMDFGFLVQECCQTTNLTGCGAFYNNLK